MRKLQLNDLTIPIVKKACEVVSMDDDLVFVDDLNKLTALMGPHKMQCLALAICAQGNAQYTVDTIRYDLQPNHILIIPAGPIFNSGEFSSDCKGIAILLSKDFTNEIIMGIHELSSLILFSRTNPNFVLKEEESREMLQHLSLIEKKMRQTGHRYRKDAVRSMITTMIYNASDAIYRVQEATNTKKTRAEAIFTKFIKMVEQNFKKERRVSWYGEQLGITPKYLSETVRNVSKRTPNQWIDKYITLELRVQLKNTTKSVKEIAQELNFPNQSFLGKFFKEQVGVSPSQYRKR